MIRILFWMLALFSLPAMAAEFETGETAHYRFEWSPGLDGYAEQLMGRVEDHHRRIYAELGAIPGRPTRVTLVREEQAMLAIAAARHGGRTPPSWADGLAYPATGEIFLHVGRGPGPLDVTFQHEISHVAMGRITPGRRLPTWFLEGIAIRQSEGFALERAWLLTEAATAGNLLPLDDLNRGFPATGGARVGVAYAQSVHFVGWLITTYGEAGFQGLLRRVGAGASLAAAAEAEFGRSLYDIERDWQSSLKVRWGWLPVIFGSTTLWAIGTLLLILAWRRRKGQRRAQFAALRAREMMEMAEDVEIHHDILPSADQHDPYDGQPPTIH